VSGLTPAEEAFLGHYLSSWNATAAARATRPDSVRPNGKAVLDRPHVQQELRRRLVSLHERADISAERVMVETARIAFADPRRLFDPNGRVLSPHELDDATAAAIKSIKVASRTVKDEDGTEYVERAIDYQFVDKGQALDKLHKHFGLYEADNAQQGDSMAEALTAAIARVQEQRRLEKIDENDLV
jgi:phage terminase small subunit